MASFLKKADPIKQIEKSVYFDKNVQDSEKTTPAGTGTGTTEKTI